MPYRVQLFLNNFNFSNANFTAEFVLLKEGFVVLYMILNIILLKAITADRTINLQIFMYNISDTEFFHFQHLYIFKITDKQMFLCQNLTMSLTILYIKGSIYRIIF